MTPMEQANAAVRIAARPVEQTMHDDDERPMESGVLVFVVGLLVALLIVAALLVLA